MITLMSTLDVAYEIWLDGAEYQSNTAWFTGFLVKSNGVLIRWRALPAAEGGYHVIFEGRAQQSSNSRILWQAVSYVARQLNI